MENSLAKMRDAVRGRFGGGRAVQDVHSATLNFGSYKYVLIIVAIAAFYYAFLASDRYVATAQIYVKQDSSTMQALMPGLGLFGSAGGASQDMLLVNAYVSSQDLLAELDGSIKFSEHFADSQWDFISRLSASPTEEDRLKYFRTRLNSELDQDAGLITLRAQGYTPEYALAFLQQVIRNSEGFINSIGQKIALEEIAFVEGELNIAKEKLETARANLLAFQNEFGILNAEASGASLQGIINALEAELVNLRTEEETLTSYLNENAAEVGAVRARIDATAKQIERERQKMASQEGVSANDVAARYQALELELKFATDQYQATLVALEQARIESYKKLKHLVVVQSPQLPEEALEPRKLYNIATLFVVLSLAYGIVTMIIATIREHRDV